MPLPCSPVSSRLRWLALVVGIGLAAGAALFRSGRWRGDAVAVLVQGGFLLVLDTATAAALPTARPPVRTLTRPE